LHPAEFVAFGDEHGPDLLEDTPRGPPLEPIVDRALGAESLGELVPLAAAPHPEEDRVEHLPPEGMTSAGGLLGPELVEDRFDPHPQLIGDLPDRAERMKPTFPVGHRRTPLVKDRDRFSRLTSFMQNGFRSFSDSF
jgi:hypothetical protein